jgi:hypothetical protein
MDQLERQPNLGYDAPELTTIADGVDQLEQAM